MVQFYLCRTAGEQQLKTSGLGILPFTDFLTGLSVSIPLYEISSA